MQVNKGSQRQPTPLSGQRYVQLLRDEVRGLCAYLEATGNPSYVFGMSVKDKSGVYVASGSKHDRDTLLSMAERLEREAARLRDIAG